jgi:hypothetical protein
MPSEREAMLERMRRQPDRLARLIEGKPDEVLRRPGAGGEWGAIEHLAHLRDFDEVTLDRLDQILNEVEPELEMFDTEVRAIEQDYHAQDPHRMLEEFRELRNTLVHRLEALSEEEWQRTADHPELGRVMLESLIQRLDAHDQSHFQTLRDDVL